MSQVEMTHLQQTDKRISYALRLARVGFWEYDRVGMHYYWSPETFSIFGIPAHKEPITAEYVIDTFIHPEDLPRIRDEVRTLSTGDYDVQYRIVLSSGEIRYIHSMALPSGKFNTRSVTGVLMDVTEHRQLRQQLVDEKEQLASLKDKYELILGTAGEGIFGVDLAGICTFVNSAACKILGYDSAELEGSLLHEKIHHRYVNGCAHPVTSCPIYSVLQDGSARQRSTDVFWKRDGSFVEVEYTATPFYEGGHVAGAVVLFRDTTRQQAAEREVRQSRDRLLQAQRFAKLGTWEMELDSGELRVSEEFTLHLGIPQNVFVEGKSLIHRIHPEDFEKIRQNYQNIKQSLPFDAEFRMTDFVGAERVIHAHGEFEQDAQGRPRVFGIVQDITERKQKERVLLEAQELLKHSEQLSVVGQLAAGIAHEIRNPLTTLKGFLQLLFSGSGVDDSTQRHYGVMKGELNRIESVLSELLMLAKPQAVIYTTEYIVPLIEEVTALMTPQANLHSVVIDITDCRENAIVNCERNQLKQVFINLIKNAIEAMPSGGTVFIRTQKRTDRLEIFCIDEGAGIPKEQLNKVGAPFYTTKRDGTGLGLLVTQRILDAHGGSITLASEIGQGTCVQILLPVMENQGS